MNVLARPILGFALLSLGLAPAAQAMTVQPVVLDLQPVGRAMSQVVTVENTFTNPLPIEMRIGAVTFDEAGAHPTDKDPGDLLVFPPQALIQPGQTQSFRVQYVGDPRLSISKHYYVTAAQLPVKMPEGQTAIQILYNFQILVSVAPPGGRPDLQIKAAEIGLNDKGEPIPVITLANNAPTYGYLSAGRLRIVERDASGKEVFRRNIPGPELQQAIGFGLVAAGQTRKIQIPLVLPTQGGRLEAQFTPDTPR